MEASKIVTFIIVALLFFIIGGGVGIVYGSKILISEAENPTIKAISSQVIPSIVAYGQVTKIEGRNVSLSYSGDSLTIKIKDNAMVYSFAADASNAAASSNQKQAQFSDVKVGDYINVNIKVTPEGNLDGQSVIILPPFPTGVAE